MVFLDFIFFMDFIDARKRENKQKKQKDYVHAKGKMGGMYISATSRSWCWNRSYTVGVLGVAETFGGPAEMASDVAKNTDGSARSTGATRADGDTGMDCVAVESAGDVVEATIGNVGGTGSNGTTGDIADGAVTASASAL